MEGVRVVGGHLVREGGARRKQEPAKHLLSKEHSGWTDGWMDGGRGGRKQGRAPGVTRAEKEGAFISPGSSHYLLKKDRSRYSKIVTHINLNVQDTHVSFWVLPVFLCSWC